MHFLYSLLPLIAFFSLVWLYNSFILKIPAWRKAYIYASITWGLYLVLSTELLSQINSITSQALGIAWGIPIVIVTGYAYFNQSNNLRIPFAVFEFKTRIELLLFLFIFCAILITAIVAWLSPPQTWDSLNYHMARVAHWAQNASIDHYATGIEVQNVISPGGEIAMLHIYILGDGDRLVTFVQWWAMVSSIVVASWVAQILGANRYGQLLAGLTVATIPMGIIQASSTVNDYIVGYWCLLAACEVINFIDKNYRNIHILTAGLAAGLALWTKPTAAAYVLPFGLILVAAIIYAVIRSRQHISSLSTFTLIAFLGFLAINAGHWIRNIQTYGNPFSDTPRLNTHLNELTTPAGITSNVIRNLSFHMAFPWGRANLLLYDSILYIHENILHLDIEDRRTTSIRPFPLMAIRTNEENAGNPVHLGLAAICFIVILTSKSKQRCLPVLYATASVGTMIVFSAVFKWQVFSSRYHMPFFILVSPFIGLALQRLRSQLLIAAVGSTLFISAFPWFFSIDSRPIIPTDRSLIGSILSTPREEILFANALYQKKSYEDLTNLIKGSSCRKIGLSLGGIQTEYLVWALMGAPHPDLEFQWFVAGTSSEQYRDLNFNPCAVICERCYGPGSESYNGLPAVYEIEEFKLYLAKEP